MENIIFKNGKHEINYRIQMNLIPEHLRDNKDIQSAIYFISLVETQSVGISEDIFRFVSHFLPVGFFDNPDVDLVASAFALRIWYATCLALEGEWEQHFFEAVSLDLFTILGLDKWHYLEFLLNHFKSMDVESCSSLSFSPSYRAWR